MRRYPNLEDKYDKKTFDNLNADEWQVDLLKLNPSYVYWGCYEDYMSKDKDGWDSRVITPTWKEHREEWNLDEYNELVNFYFEVYRKNHQCEHCEGDAINPATKKISDDWYSFDKSEYIYSEDRQRRWNNLAWSNHITEVEIDALMKSGRLSDVSGFRGYYDSDNEQWLTWENGEKVVCEKPEYPTPEAVNKWNREGMGHDAINKWICVKARAKHLGVYGECEHCVDGYIYDEPKARVALQLWYLHPRKGCSRGVYIENVDQEDLPSIYQYLKEARDRNNDRFSKII